VTYDEVCDLLAVAASFDRRTIGEADSEAWESAVGDLSFDDARAAVIAHYRETRDWVMPSDVRQRVKAMRLRRLEATPLPAPACPDYPGRYQELIRASVQRIADGASLNRAIAGTPLPGDPPAEWQQAREAMAGPAAAKPDPRDLAREQAEEARTERERREGREAS
jgi:hypothetical protein